MDDQKVPARFRSRVDHAIAEVWAVVSVLVAMFLLFTAPNNGSPFIVLGTGALGLIIAFRPTAHEVPRQDPPQPPRVGPTKDVS